MIIPSDEKSGERIEDCRHAICFRFGKISTENRTQKKEIGEPPVRSSPAGPSYAGVLKMVKVTGKEYPKVALATRWGKSFRLGMPLFDCSNPQTPKLRTGENVISGAATGSEDDIPKSRRYNLLPTKCWTRQHEIVDHGGGTI